MLHVTLRNQKLANFHQMPLLRSLDYGHQIVFQRVGATIRFDCNLVPRSLGLRPQEIWERD